MPFLEGWAQIPGNSHLWHYYQDGLSLCGRHAADAKPGAPVIIHEAQQVAKGEGRFGKNGDVAECYGCAERCDERAKLY